VDGDEDDIVSIVGHTKVGFSRMGCAVVIMCEVNGCCSMVWIQTCF
jgi:hypothetical protein